MLHTKCSAQVLTNYLSDERIVDVYQTSDFRQTFVWRGLCFQSEEERQKYLTVLDEKSYQPLDEILRILEGDMKKNGKMGASESIESMGLADFGRKLQVYYFFNICFPFSNGLLKPVFSESLHAISTKRKR